MFHSPAPMDQLCTERKAFLKSTIISILQEGASDSNSEAEDDEPPASPAPKKKKKKDGYMKLLAVSEQLAPLMGVSEIKRSDVRHVLMRGRVPRRN